MSLTPKKICLLDPQPLSAQNIGISFKNMFSHIPFVHIDLFSLHSHQWPVPNLKVSSLDSNDTISSNASTLFSHITSSYDALCVGGSEDSVLMGSSLFYLETLLQLLKNCVNANFPVLCICFGAQALAASVYGKQVIFQLKNCNLPDGEHGFKQFTILQPNCPLFNGFRFLNSTMPSLPAAASASFDNVATHNDCFVLTGKTNSLCKTSEWEHQAFQVDGKKVFGLQFHPELTNKEALELFEIEEKNGFKIKHEKEETNEEVGRKIASNFVDLL